MSHEGSATLPEHLARWAAERRRAVAFQHKLHGRWVVWTWGDLQGEVARVAAALAARGFGPSDVVAIATSPCPQGLAVALAAQRLGGAAIWVDPEDAGGGSDERSAGAAAATVPAARFGFARDEATLAKLQARFGSREPWALGLVTAEHAPPQDGPGSFVRAYADVAASDAVAPLRARPSDTAFFFAGGGASGPAAPSALTHAALVAAARAWLSAEEVAAGDRAFTWEAPTAEAAAIFVAGWLVSGIRLQLPEDKTTSDADRRELQPTIVAATGAAYGRLAQQVADNLPLPGTSLRTLVDAGLATTGAGRVRRALGKWLVCRPLREVLGLRKAKAALVLGPAPPAAAEELFVRLGRPLRGLPLDAAAPETVSRRVADHASLFEPALALSSSTAGKLT